MKVYCRMETGLGKEHIEDRVIIENTILAGGVYLNELPANRMPFTVAVADGVGGNNAGNVASHMAAEGVASFQIPMDSDEATITQLVNETNERIVEKSKWDPKFHKMATTLTGLCHVGNKWLLFHVGNTRVYVWKHPYLTQLTTDHSWVKEMQLMGMNEEEIKKSGRATEITSCLGNGDTSAAKKLQVYDVTSEVASAQMLLLTSDGVHEYIAEDALEFSFQSIEDVHLYMEQAMAFARQNGSYDDLSMVIVDFREDAQ